MIDLYLQEDLDLIAKSSIPTDKLKGANVFVTGATGYIGVQLIRAMQRIDAGINIVALIRNEEKAGAIYGDCTKGITFIKGDVTDPIEFSGDIDYIFHCASVASSKIMITHPVETILTALEGTKNVLDFAKEKQVRSMVYLSSMEMYGSFSDGDHEVTETDIGCIDPLKVRSNYPESKRMCENMCIAYHAEFGVPVKIARLAQTFGAGVLRGESRVFAQFARSVLRGENIVLHTKGLSEGNYCYSRDAIIGLFTILIKGSDGEAYNVSNPDTHTTIAAMAAMVAEKIAGGRIKVEFDIPETNSYGYAQDTKMKLNSDKLQKLGWKPEVGLEEAYRRLIGTLEATGDY